MNKQTKGIFSRRHVTEYRACFEQHNCITLKATWKSTTVRSRLPVMECSKKKKKKVTFSSPSHRNRISQVVKLHKAAVKAVQELKCPILQIRKPRLRKVSYLA